MVGTCPRCAALVRANAVEQVGVDGFTGEAWRSVVYECPQCRGVLGIDETPLSLQKTLMPDSAGKRTR